MPNLSAFSINNQFAHVVEMVTNSKYAVDITLDFEASYTHRFFNDIQSRAGSKGAMKHFLQQHGSYHCWEHSEVSWPYMPQWQLGLYLDVFSEEAGESVRQFVYLSNLEPYREKSRAFLEILRLHLSRHTLIGQNIKFDLVILTQIMGLTEEEVLTLHVHDLMTMGYALDIESKRFALDIAAKRHLADVMEGKGDGAVFKLQDGVIEVEWKQTEEFHRTLLESRFDETVDYNYKDLLITHAIYQRLQRKLQEAGVLDRVNQIYTWFIPLYTQLEMNGLLVDETRAENAFFQSAEDGLIAKLEVSQLAIEFFAILKSRGLHRRFQSEFLDKLPDGPESFTSRFKFFDFDRFELVTQNCVSRKKTKISFNSGQYLSIDIVSGTLFFELMSTLLATCLEFYIQKTPTGKYSFQQDDIALLIDRLKVSTDPFDVLVHQLLTKMMLINSLKANLARVKAIYLLPAKMYYSHRLHSDYKLTGTETGRISSVRPGIMNLPMRIKALIKGREKIIQIDLRSAEAKLFMLLTQNREILLELQKNDDTYSVIGMRVFELDWMCKKSRPIERNIMKIGVLAKMYGQSIAGLAEQIKIYYQPVKWEIYTDRKKYHFFYKWECFKNMESWSEQADSVAEELVRQTEKLSTALDFELRESVPDDKSRKKEVDEKVASDQKIAQLRVQLNELILVDYFKMAVICDKRLEDTINSGRYEDWICETFINEQDPANSRIVSPAGLIRPFDQSAASLVFEFNHQKVAQDKVYHVLMAAYQSFFKKGVVYSGEFFAGDNEFVTVECRRLHALNAVVSDVRRGIRWLRKAVERDTSESEITFKIAKRAKKIFSGISVAVPEDQHDSLYSNLVSFFDLSNNCVIGEVFVKAAQRLAARYRESLNLPIQGMSSFLNSRIAHKTYLDCLRAKLPVKVVNTVHDANHFDHADTSLIDPFLELANAVYTDMDLLKELLDAGLQSIHPDIVARGDDFVYIPIGGDPEVCDFLSEAK